MSVTNIWTQFSEGDLVGQFALSREPLDLDWRIETLDGWHLAVQQDLRCTTVFMDGEKAGWLLGSAVSATGVVVDEDLTLSRLSFEEQIFEHAGRYLFILPKINRIYPDPCGLLSSVFSQEYGIVAATASVLAGRRNLRLKEELVSAMKVPEESAMFPLGLTPWEGIDRLLPNHYLDLDTWAQVRIWPREELALIEDIDEALCEVSACTKRYMFAFFKNRSPGLQLTSGRDSRLLLALLRSKVSELSCITADFSDSGSRTDIAVARKLAKYAGVAEHKIIKWVPPVQHDLNLWIYRTALGVGEYRGWQGFTSYLRGIDRSLPLIYGNGPDIGKGRYWRSEDNKESHIPTERLLGVCGCPVTPEALQRVDSWKASLDFNDSLLLLDLFCIEQRLGSWAGIWSYAGYTCEPIFSFCHRRTIELLLRLPVELRRKKGI